MVDVGICYGYNDKDDDDNNNDDDAEDDADDDQICCRRVVCLRSVSQCSGFQN